MTPHKDAASQWLEHNSALEKAPRQATEDDIVIKPLYTPEDIADLDYKRDLGFPGQAPFTRHVYKAGYLGRYWQMRLYSGFGSAEDTNNRWKFLLASGNDGVSAAF